MACMDHTCRDCGAGWSNNNPCSSCPTCGGVNVFSVHDEELDRRSDLRDDRFDDEVDDA